MKKQLFTFMVSVVIFTTFTTDKKGLKAPQILKEADAPIIFPKPTGPFSVGYKSIEFTDESRKDPYNPGHKRQLKVTVWHPSRDSLKLEPYGPEERISMERTLRDEKVAPSDLKTFMEQFDRLKVYKSGNAAPIKGKFPVILLEHGYGATPGSYQSLIQELVSNGYIVVATHHPYIADDVLFQNGNEALQDIEKVKKDNTLIKTSMDDVSFVLGALSKMKPLSQYMDLEKIGLLGHSLGGIITMKTARVDKRIKAAVELDAPMKTTLAEMNIDPLNPACFEIPFLYIFADKAFRQNITDDKGVILQKKEDIWNDFNGLCMKKNNFKAIITDTAHNSFTDYVLLKDMFPFLKKKGLTFEAGENNGFKIYPIVALLIHSFFDRFLKNKTEIDLMKFNNENIRIETVKE
jgi:dienelactone hydrolase